MAMTGTIPGKQEEVARIKAENGIAEVEEPALNLEGVNIIEGQGKQPNIPDEPEGISGTSGSGQGAGNTGNIRPGKE